MAPSFGGRVLRNIAYCLLLIGLVGCGGSDARAPVEDRHARPAPAGDSYTVQRGDTLYSIAFRYRLDFRRLAAANGIPAPYTIYPGQRIRLHEGALQKGASQKGALAPPAAAATPRTPAVPRPASPSTTAPTTPAPASRPAVATPYPAQSPAPAPVKKPAPVTKPSPGSAINRGAAAVGGPIRAWRWPTAGRVTRGYSASVHKGIDIDGRRGDAIHAVADGVIVYAGTGIVGFGQLLIVKHNEEYLSAYGHNERLLVKEGDRVRAGQQIAEKGSSGTDTVKLHFEIRRRGKPVDPQALLPRR
ncbi:MAG: peptidoglycan DD-metalloendopeptidase family protein [Halioglobus sp.]